MSSRSINFTNQSSSVTFTVASSFVSTSPLAVTTVVVYFSQKMTVKIQFGRVKVFPTDHMQACSRVHHKLSFLRLYCGCGQLNPLIGWRIDCEIFRVFHLKDIIGKSPRVSAGASLLSFSLLLRPILKFWSVWTSSQALDGGCEQNTFPHCTYRREHCVHTARCTDTRGSRCLSCA